jgi:hypothetical protein
MPDQRKPPIGKTGRHERATLPADSPGFSIESTTMRLKSMKLRRAEVEKQEAERLTAAKDETVKLKPDGRPPAASATTSAAWRCGTGPWPPARSPRSPPPAP